MGLYESFEERKNNGEVLDFDKLTKEELRQIWFEELYSEHKKNNPFFATYTFKEWGDYVVKTFR